VGTAGPFYFASCCFGPVVCFVEQFFRLVVVAWFVMGHCHQELKRRPVRAFGILFKQVGGILELTGSEMKLRYQAGLPCCLFLRQLLFDNLEQPVVIVLRDCLRSRNCGVD
jgi:hypothetical protein